MSLINICIIFSLIFLCLPKSLCQTIGCFHETFDDSMSSGISSTCASFNKVSPWVFDTYDNTIVERPVMSTSDGFIMANLGTEEQHCISNNDVLNAVDGSEIQLSYFANGAAIIVVMLTNVIDKSIVDSVFVPIVYDEWTTYSFPLAAGELSFSILGGVSNDSSLIVIDSVTYVDARKDLHYCIYGVNAPETDTTPLTESSSETPTLDTTVNDTSAENTHQSTSEVPPEEILEPAPAPLAEDVSEPESRTLALALSIVFSILFALAVGIACHCIQIRKQSKRTRL